MRINVEYCFPNENATCGYTKGKIDYPKNPRKTTGSEVCRLLAAAAEKEKRPVIFIAYNLYGK